jgi:hypothetical protein
MSMPNTRLRPDRVQRLPGIAALGAYHHFRTLAGAQRQDTQHAFHARVARSVINVDIGFERLGQRFQHRGRARVQSELRG